MTNPDIDCTWEIHPGLLKELRAAAHGNEWGELVSALDVANEKIDRLREDARLLDRCLDSAVKLMREIEWAGHGGRDCCCPCCGRPSLALEDDGGKHSDGCGLAAILLAAKE